ncbi:MAG: SDR family oxidoreductase [Alphaproteobacteria bacterium]|nr:SDR family oxidoreductase [Alphaproteobacteria bacterium]
MAGRTFLVSGGSGDIGAAVCRRLAALGYEPVVGFARSSETAARTAAACGGMALELDLSSPQSIAAALAALEHGPSELRGVVLAASPPPRIGPFGKISADEMAVQWTVNVAGPQQLLAGLVRQHFRRARRGTVIGILSEAMGDASKPAMAGMGAYIIAKHGMAGMLGVLAAEHPWLRVGTVSPGFTDTRMLRAFDERFLELQRGRAAFRQADDVAAEIATTIERFESETGDERSVAS